MRFPNVLPISLGVVFLSAFSGCHSRDVAFEGAEPNGSTEVGSVHTAAASEQAVRNFCGSCHVVPSPASFPAEYWEEKVADGFLFYRQSGRKDLAVPSIDAVVAYFVERAPIAFDMPAIDRVKAGRMEAGGLENGRASSRFGPAELVSFPAPLAAVSNLTALPVAGAPTLFVSDMRTGNVWLAGLSSSPVSPSQTSAGSSPIGMQPAGMTPINMKPIVAFDRCLNPCRISPIRFSNNETDYLVSDLGSFFPEDHALGGVWLATRNTENQFELHSILAGVGRVADARAGDFDSDGDSDVIVAEFGWRKTGSITLLRNASNENGAPTFTPEVVDNRHGATVVPIADIDADGDLDFITLLSQEFEEIDVFLNRGDGSFDREIIFANDNPAFGSSHLELVDIDADGDLDVAFVNGDSLDTPVAKPYHGVRWLENNGSYPFVVHELGSMPGAHCVRTGDIDADGDIDLAVVALLPGSAIEKHPPGTFDSVAWFEQKPDRSFVRHRLEADSCNYAVCELLDCDADSDLDLIVGEMARDLNADRPLKVFSNRTNPAAQK